jgi:hypothetical protein
MDIIRCANFCAASAGGATSVVFAPAFTRHWGFVHAGFASPWNYTLWIPSPVTAADGMGAATTFSVSAMSSALPFTYWSGVNG